MKDKEIKKITKKISRYDNVSFDIFDTLIKRNCEKPDDIFEISQKRYNNISNAKISNFRNLRINAEIEARNTSKDEEITLSDIYNNINEEIDKKTMMKIEKEVEIEFCTQNKDLYKIYEHCVQKGKKIYFTSDMYLDKETIIEILNRNGYNNGKLYLSSEYKKSKTTGNLFNVLCKKEGIKKNEIIHIGNSKRADFCIPMIQGIKAIKIKTEDVNTSYLKKNSEESLENKILYYFINNHVSGYDAYEKIGYELLGPISYAFCCWLHEKVVQNKIDNILFCARDMFFIQKIYNIIWKDENTENKYFYISRKSIRMPYFYKKNEVNDFCKILPDMKKMSIYDVLKNNGIKINKGIEKSIIEYNLKEKNLTKKNIIKDKEFNEFYKKEIQAEIYEEGKKQYNCFKKYLKSINWGEKTCLVDLGWNGTIQMSMEEILNKKIEGFYFGIDKNAYDEIQKEAHGFLFGKNENLDIEDKIYSFRTLFEILFQALHGTTLEYIEKEPFYRIGKPDNPNNEIIKKIQENAIKFAEEFRSTNIKYSNIDFVLNSLINIGINPTYKQAVIFGDFNYDNITTGKLAKPKRISYYVIHPKKFMEEFKETQWKIGFLKRLIRVKINYYKLYEYFRKRRDK